MKPFCNHDSSAKILLYRAIFFCPSVTKYRTFLSFQADKAVAEEKLSLAKPALEEAEAALQVNLDEFYSYFYNCGARNQQ